MSAPALYRILPLAAATLLLPACMSLSGLSGQSDYACKAPEGVTCQSVSGIYANVLADNLPSQRRRAPAAVTVAAAAAVAPAATPSPPMSAAGGTTLRSAPRILRLWFKPWEDADGDLFDQGYLYVQIDSGRWLVEHAQRAIREAHAPVRTAAPRTGAEASASPALRPAEERPSPQRPDRPTTPPPTGAPQR